MAAEFDTEPNYTDEDTQAPPPAEPDTRDDRALWGTLALLALAAVVLLVLLTQCTARVPNTVGLTLGDAKIRLEAAGLPVGQVSETAAGSGKPGCVNEQAPHAGATVRKGTSVDLMVAHGTNLSIVPDVCGQRAASASVELLQAGFEIASADEYSDFAPLGTAVSQSPPAGARAESGSTVTVYYSLGPQSAADVAVSRSLIGGATDASADGSTGSGGGPLMMNCTRAYPGATAWSSGGDIYVRLSPGAAARRVTSTGDWDTNPVISPSHKYLVFLRASGSGEKATSVGAVCFTTFDTHMLSLPTVNFVGAQPVYYGKVIFAPSANSTRANTDWIVFPQYWPEPSWGATPRPWSSARLLVCNVPMSSSWVSWNERFRPAKTLTLSPSTRAGCVLVTQKSGSNTVYSRNFNVTTGLYLR